MAKFYLLMQQSGRGCDYTIGCGVRWDGLDAPTLEAAAEIAVARVRDHGWRGDMVQAAVVVPAEAAFDLAPLLDADVARARREESDREREVTEAAEREKLAELRRKYPDA